MKLDGARPHLFVRRAIVKGGVEPPKSRHGRRTVPNRVRLVSARRQQHVAELPGDPDALVFPSKAGTPLDSDNVRARVLKPVTEEVGGNLLRLSRVLGHHSPSFTLER